MLGCAGPVLTWSLRLIPPECSIDPHTNLLQHPHLALAHYPLLSACSSSIGGLLRGGRTGWGFSLWHDRYNVTNPLNVHAGIY